MVAQIFLKIKHWKLIIIDRCHSNSKNKSLDKYRNYRIVVEKICYKRWINLSRSLINMWGKVKC